MSEINELEQQLDRAKKVVERREKALRLAENREFRELVLDGFCRDDCARLAHESGDPALTADQRAVAADMSRAAGHLKRYLSTMVLQGNTAEREIIDLNEALEEARQEGEIEDDFEGEAGPEA